MHVTISMPLCLPIAFFVSCENIDPAPPPQARSCGAAKDCPIAEAGICDPASFTCRACRPSEDDARCRERSAATPRCGATGACVACAGEGQSRDCADLRRPTCSAGACVACAKPADCQSQVCQPDGACADPKNMVFVDNQDGACDGAKPHAGSADDPLCDVQAGVEAARTAKKPIVRIGGRAAPYGAVSINATPPGGLTLIGVPSGEVAPQLRADPPALSVIGGAERVIVTVLGLDLSSKSAEAVLCDQRTGASPPELSIRRAALHDADRAGLAALKCKLTLDGVRVYNNSQGGLRLSGTTYALSNLMVYGNSRGAGVALLDVPQAGAGSSLRFCTIAYNFYVGQPAGLDCGGQQIPVESSIIVNNFGAGSQFRGCRLKDVVVGTDAVPAGIMKAPEFLKAQDPLDLRLQSSQANRDCCIDKIQPAPGLPAQDIDGRNRPQGSAWDIGAHEVPL